MNYKSNWFIWTYIAWSFSREAYMHHAVHVPGNPWIGYTQSLLSPTADCSHQPHIGTGKSDLVWSAAGVEHSVRPYLCKNIFSMFIIVCTIDLHLGIWQKSPEHLATQLNLQWYKALGESILYRLQSKADLYKCEDVLVTKTNNCRFKWRASANKETHNCSAHTRDAMNQLQNNDLVYSLINVLKRLEDRQHIWRNNMQK